MDGFELTTEQVQTAGGAVSDAGVALNSEIAQMDQILADLRVSWTSTSAAPKYALAMDSHLASARLLKDALLSHGEGLVMAGNNIAGSEAALGEQMPVVS
ncbi:hypothetical protein EH165_14000 [Nakamurella antarctica]|uniref:WXG100 family type VII secretion target n=1 Tax=Nakamurella antarctica TaxID=1902245 RepID=A0A3G8ZYH9_9ACTN|nr:hypothetical protein [Nakamurella antarctica]AZI59086.1 hypothetical protein EH165_14000 [Nakamurella antarctica]